VDRKDKSSRIKVLLQSKSTTMNFDVKEIFTAGMVLFAVIDIIGSIPIVISLRAKVGHIQSEKASIEMVLGISLYKDEEPETASIVPLAFPMIAGAGTLTSLLSLRAEYHVINIIVAILINIIIVYLILKSSQKIENLLGRSGINIIRKIFGVVLLAIAVKLFTTNIQQIF
jgi:multiple antibiotic resistance protein